MGQQVTENMVPEGTAQPEGVTQHEQKQPEGDDYWKAEAKRLIDERQELKAERQQLRSRLEALESRGSKAQPVAEKQTKTDSSDEIVQLRREMAIRDGLDELGAKLSKAQKNALTRLAQGVELHDMDSWLKENVSLFGGQEAPAAEPTAPAPTAPTQSIATEVARPSANPAHFDTNASLPADPRLIPKEIVLNMTNDELKGRFIAFERGESYDSARHNPATPQIGGRMHPFSR